MQTIHEVQEQSVSEHTGAHRELLRRVVTSSTFGRAERLSTLLTYICEQSFKGHGESLNEQHVGEAVFGRPRGYDCSIDGIVRTQASRLRQRLATYFDGEGLAEPIRIIVPPGGYVPFFQPRPSEPLGVSVASDRKVVGLRKAVVTQLSPAPVAWNHSKLMRYAGLCLVAMLGIAIGLEFKRLQHRPATTNNPLWAEMFLQGKPALVVPGDSGLVMWGGLMNRDPTLSEYIKGSYLDAPATTDRVALLAADLGSRRYTSSVDLNVVKTLTTVSQSVNSSINVRYARDVRPNDLKHGNVILIGAREANPWLQLFEPNLNFILSVQRDHKRYVVLDRKPQALEPAEWISSGGDQTRSMVFSLVAYLPNLDGEGNVLILEGDTMAGTECAWDFVNDEVRFAAFLQTIRPSGKGPIPHFEVLLTTQNMSGSATRGSVLAVRTHS